MSDYDRIASAIAFIADRVHEQPTLNDIAAHLHMSPFHFQRLFCRWAGVTPKRFLQVLTLEQSKPMLTGTGSLLEVSDSLGLSSGSRLYDHFVQLESVTPGEYRSRGRDISIVYGVQDTPFGPLFVAITARGVCRAAFLEYTGIDAQLADLQRTWPLATIHENGGAIREVVESMLGGVGKAERPLSLHVSGTNFQVAVWKALLHIPPGILASYSAVATAMGRPRAARAVGHAIAANPVAYLIPCHRVIRQSGALGGYHWGETRKRVIQVWEAARSTHFQDQR